MKKSSFLSLKATALLSVVPAVAGLCLLTSCNREELPAEGKYNVTVALSTDGTKALNLDENESVSSIVIYAFADVDDAVGSGTLVGYYYSNAVGDGQDTFPMRLTGNGESGMVDFFVILNPDSEDFKIYNSATNAEVNFGSSAPATLQPSEILSWKLKRNTGGNSAAQNIPMCNLALTKATSNQPAQDNRSFEVKELRNTWQTIEIEVTRAVSKVEVWLWSNDEKSINWPYTWNYSGITGLKLTDPVSSTEMFNDQSGDNSNYISGVTFTAEDTNPHNRTTLGNFPAYDKTNAAQFYSDAYFKKVWEQYILPNTFFGGNNMGEIASGSATGDYTTLVVSYSDYAGSTETEKNSQTIYLPESARNTKIKIWCAFNLNEDRSFTYTVEDWDETVTVDIPEFD